MVNGDGAGTGGRRLEMEHRQRAEEAEGWMEARDRRQRSVADS